MRPGNQCGNEGTALYDLSFRPFPIADAVPLRASKGAQRLEVLSGGRSPARPLGASLRTVRDRRARRSAPPPCPGAPRTTRPEKARRSLRQRIEHRTLGRGLVQSPGRSPTLVMHSCVIWRPPGYDPMDPGAHRRDGSTARSRRRQLSPKRPARREHCPRRCPRADLPQERRSLFAGTKRVSDGTRTRGRRDHNPHRRVRLRRIRRSQSI